MAVELRMSQSIQNVGILDSHHTSIFNFLIQQDIRNAINIHTFKKEYKKLLLKKYELA